MKLLTHLGLGDHLITYGLVRELQTRYGHVLLFCKQHNFKSLERLYHGSGVHPIVVESEVEAFEKMGNTPYNSLKIGYTTREETDIDFGKSFYDQANVSWDVRYKYSIPRYRSYIFPPEESPEIFIHDTDEFKINIAGFRAVPDLTDNILDYCSFIENAKEVHVIESSFRQLIEFLNPKGKLFLHKFNDKSFRVVPSKHNWTIV